MINNPLISVIIPVYNAENDFPRCIESIINQTHRNLQIIVIDDGSTDRSAAVIDDYASRDSRITVVHQLNKGVSAARNRGLEIAIGDYYHFPDGDDFIELDTYEYCLGLIRRYGCDAVNFEHFGTFPQHETIHQLSKDSYGLKDRYYTQKLLCTKVAFACNKLFSKQLITGLRFREDIFRGEDSFFAREALLRAKSVWFDSRPLYHYVQNDESACRGAFRESQLSGMKLFDAYNDMYAEYPDLLQIHIANMGHLCTTLYYDMYADAKDWTPQQKDVHQHFCDHYHQMMKSGCLSGRDKTKYRFFRYAPDAFCKFHERLHKL